MGPDTGRTCGCRDRLTSVPSSWPANLSRIRRPASSGRRRRRRGKTACGESDCESSAFPPSVPSGAAAEWARIRTCSAPARQLPVELAERIDFLIVNLIEAECLTGHHDPEAALTALAHLVRGAVILTQSANGAILMENGQMTHHPAFSTEVVSTHGAGDMFTGALAARITAGDSLQSALRFSQAAAGLLVSSPIERRSEVTHAAVEAFLACR